MAVALESTKTQAVHTQSPQWEGFSQFIHTSSNRFGRRFREPQILLSPDQGYNAGMLSTGNDDLMFARVRRTDIVIPGVTPDFSTITTYLVKDGIEQGTAQMNQSLDFLHHFKSDNRSSDQITLASVEDGRLKKIDEDTAVMGYTGVLLNKTKSDPSWIGLLQVLKVNDDKTVEPQGNPIVLPFQCKNITPLEMKDGRISFIFRNDEVDANGDPLETHKLYVAHVDIDKPPQTKEELFENNIDAVLELPTDIHHAQDRIGTIDATIIPLENGNFYIPMHGQTILNKQLPRDKWIYVYTLFIAEFTNDGKFVGTGFLANRLTYQNVLPRENDLEKNKFVAYALHAEYDDQAKILRIVGGPGDNGSDVMDWTMSEIIQAREEGYQVIEDRASNVIDLYPEEVELAS